MATMLRIKDVKADRNVESREQLDMRVADEYKAELLADKSFEFDPVDVFFDGETYWLAHGFHRWCAYANAGRDSIPAEVREGTRRDAVLFSVGANARNGMRRTNADKRRAISMLLSDPEWGQWSDREIGKQCSVNHETVASVRASLQVAISPDTAAPRIAKRGSQVYTIKPKAKPAKKQAPKSTPAEDAKKRVASLKAKVRREVRALLADKPPKFHAEMMQVIAWERDFVSRNAVVRADELVEALDTAWATANNEMLPKCPRP